VRIRELIIMEKVLCGRKVSAEKAKTASAARQLDIFTNPWLRTPFFFSETACAGDIWNAFQVPEFSRDHLVVTHDYRGTGQSSRED
jgi:hypothetical protein